MPRVLCLDYGDKNIGVAVSDPLGLTAQAVTVVRRADEKAVKPVLRELAGLISEYGVSSIVLGYPRNMDGSEGFRCEKTRAFKERLENRFGLPVELWDERLSTVGADRGLSHLTKDRRDEVIDKMAAVFILQGYLDYSHKRRENEKMEENKNSGEFEGFEDGFEGDYEPVTLVDEDGTESEYLIVDDLVDNGATYYLLIAAGDEDSETADAQILKEAVEDGESVLKELDDEEFDRISAMFENDDYSLEV